MTFPVSISSAFSIAGTRPLSYGAHTTVHTEDRANIIGLSTKLGLGSATPTGTLALVGSGAGTSTWAQIADRYIAGTANISPEKFGTLVYWDIGGSIDQSVANATWTTMNWSHDISDAFNLFSTATPTYVTVPYTGLYFLYARVVWTYHPTGARYFGITGATGIPTKTLPGVTSTNDPDAYEIFGFSRISSGVPLYVQVYQTSGGTLVLNSSWLHRFIGVKLSN